MQRVLLANNHMSLLGGTETWTYTMAAEFARRGFEVEVFTREPGFVSDMCKPFAAVVNKPTGKYAAMLINHNLCLDALRDHKSFKIFTSHGPVVSLEHPIVGASTYVSVSEETRDFLAKRGFDSQVIRQPIDLERFVPTHELPEKPQKILALCKTAQAMEWVKVAADEVGAKVVWLRGWDRARWDMPEQIGQADVVISAGRGAVEGMACGRAVLNFDSRVYNDAAYCDGWVVPQTLPTIHGANFSTRGFRAVCEGPDQIAHALKHYDPAMGPTNRQLAEQHHDVKNIAEQYLALIP